MELTSAQRKFLTTYREARLEPKSLAGQLRPALPRLLFLIALVAAGAYKLPTWAACLYGGFAAGAVTRHVTMVIQSRRRLPLLFDIIDWPKVDRLLDGVEKPLTRADS